MNSDVGEHDNSAEFDPVVDSIDRKLASLRLGNETDADGEDGTADAYAYRPVSVSILTRIPECIPFDVRIETKYLRCSLRFSTLFCLSFLSVRCR